MTEKKVLLRHARTRRKPGVVFPGVPFHALSLPRTQKAIRVPPSRDRGPWSVTDTRKATLIGRRMRCAATSFSIMPAHAGIQVGLPAQCPPDDVIPAHAGIQRKGQTPHEAIPLRSRPFSITLPPESNPGQALSLSRNVIPSPNCHSEPAEGRQVVATFSSRKRITRPLEARFESSDRPRRTERPKVTSRPTSRLPQ